MNRSFALLILFAIPILSLLIVFPSINRTSNDQKINQIYNNIEYAKNLCTALCSKYSSYNLTGACISDSDTITGKYWIYQNISCYVGPDGNPCIDKGIVEVKLFENCSIEKVSFINQQINQK